MKQAEFWRQVSRVLQSGEALSLLLVVHSTGSSPGRPGFKMAVTAGGEIFGSIGGGIMEVKLAELAKDRLQRGETAVLFKKQIHRKTAARDRSGMICSGEQYVAILSLSKMHLKTVRQIIQHSKTQNPAVLRVTRQEFGVLKIKEHVAPFRFETTGNGDFLYEEILGCPNRLYIVGGGHCALALSEIMSKLDFQIHLFDDRPGLNTLTKNRFVQEKRVIEQYDRIDQLIPESWQVYLVVMTLGYRTDTVVLRRLLHRDWKYLGVLGSAAKMTILLNALEQEGFSKEKLKQIRTPAGLSIRSRTPEEIAISIAAEIISVKNQ